MSKRHSRTAPLPMNRHNVAPRIRKSKPITSLPCTTLKYTLIVIAFYCCVLFPFQSKQQSEILVVSTETNAATNNQFNAPVVNSNDITDKKRSHQCLNEDFKPTNKVSVWTMLNDNPSYVLSALKLGRALKKHTKSIDFDLVVMTLKSKPLSDESMKQLTEVGFTNCVVESIRPTHVEGKTRGDLTEKFGVLRVFSMTIYDTVLFLDADTFVNGPLDDLLKMDLQGKTIGVTKDIRNRKWVDTFNSGVMLLHPSEKDYNYLMKLLMDKTFEFEYVMSDQGFLNAVYKDNWHEIGFIYNANLALYRFQRPFWDEHKLEDIRIIHYTMQKPWKCQANGPYGPICKIWIDAE